MHGINFNNIFFFFKIRVQFNIWYGGTKKLSLKYFGDDF